ncbi:NUDIX hydrolase [Luteococcus peritonei]|uniref:NUDIX domain-containing protein n=1 Tax=Luteococcus peritonei TaxID=88874 RepID=A0ABW4RWC4_9ACTN
MESTHGWTTLGSRTVYENPWISVREDQVVRPDGGQGIYGVVRVKSPSVFVVALTDDDEVLLVQLYRFATRRMSLEVPAGGTDGQGPELAARRELLEETGFEATSWTEVGRMDALNGICDAPEHVFLARGLRPATDQQLARQEQQAEGISQVRAVAWPEVMRMVRQGEIHDGESVAALMYAALHLGRVG